MLTINLLFQLISYVKSLYQNQLKFFINNNLYIKIINTYNISIDGYKNYLFYIVFIFDFESNNNK